MYQVIYFDPSTGALYRLDDNNTPIPVKTSAQFDPNSVGITSDGVLSFKGFDGQWYQVTDEQGNLISLIGPQGPAGKDGINGQDGLKGQDGISPKINLSEDGILQIEDAFHTISANIKGPKGEQGLQGLQGVQGEKGDSGINGNDGADGKTYIPTVDLDGTLFWKIDEPTEIPQSVNIKGPKGDVGEKGDMGEKGADGLTFTPSISEDGILSWTNSGDVLNPQPISIKGPKGDQGETGAQGPQGEKGEKGEQGPQGEKGADGQTPVFEIADGSLKYKVGDQDWTNLITDKSIFTQPDIQTELPNEPTDGQIILWEGNPSMETDVRLTPGCKYQYLAAGKVLKNTRLIGKAPNSESYTVFKLRDASTVPSFSLYNIKKEILTSSDKVVTLQGIYSKLVLEEGQTSLVSLQTIYDDGGKGFMSKITNSDQVKALIDANPTETHWAVVELEEVLESGVWIQIS